MLSSISLRKVGSFYFFNFPLVPLEPLADGTALPGMEPAIEAGCVRETDEGIMRCCILRNCSK